MGWFDWLKPHRSAPAKLFPESRWLVALSEDGIEATDDEGTARAVAWGDLSGVVIETNDTGPWGADIWWLLFGREDRVACAFPQGASGDSDAIARLTKLPGFDHRSMGEAMASTDNRVFPVWRRAG